MLINEILTLDKLELILEKNKNVKIWYEPLLINFEKFNINTINRISAFLAQTTHESRDFLLLKENFNYRLETLLKVFPKYFPNESIAKYYINLDNKTEAIANRVYANRMGNGNEKTGDGWKYSGKGIIQITGKYNYQKFADYKKIKLESVSDYLSTPFGAIESACWFWDANNLNDLADKEDVVKISKIINGGKIGLTERLEKYKTIKKIIEV